MGNCLRGNRVMAISPATEAKKVERVLVTGSAMARSGVPRCTKAARFELEEDEICGGRGSDDGGGGVERIKVVMSRKDLKRILKDGEKDSGELEKLIGELMIRGRAGAVVISDAGTEELEDENRRWSPALETIPEHLD